MSNVLYLLFPYHTVSKLKKHLFFPPTLLPYDIVSTFPFCRESWQSIDIYVLFGSKGTKPKDYSIFKPPVRYTTVPLISWWATRGKKMRFCWYSCSGEMGFKLGKIYKYLLVWLFCKQCCLGIHCSVNNVGNSLFQHIVIIEAQVCRHSGWLLSQSRTFKSSY